MFSDKGKFFKILGKFEIGLPGKNDFQGKFVFLKFSFQ